MFIVLDPTRVKKCKAYFSDEFGRSIGLKCRIEGARRATYIIGLYAPNNETENMRFVNGLSTPDRAGKADLILGDFNRVESAIDRNPHRKDELRVVQALKSLRAARGLVDG